MKVSYAITVCDEFHELKRLVDLLLSIIESNDDIVIQYDKPRTSSAVLEFLNALENAGKRIFIVPFVLADDFAAFKNNLRKFCSGDYIFQIDADEYPSPDLILGLRRQLERHPVDVVTIARINIVKGITPDHLQEWGWRIDDNGWINFPDPQTRVYRNSESIFWTHRLHERLVGYKTEVRLPWVKRLALVHSKTIERQEKQNKRYKELPTLSAD